MMIGTSARRGSLRMWRRDLVAVHARHFDVEQDHVRHVLGSSAIASMAVLGASTRMPLRSSSRWVTRRIRDRIVHDQHEDALVARRRTEASTARPRHSERTSAPMSRNDDDCGRPPGSSRRRWPRTEATCGPTDLTTISRLPTSSSVTSAVECSPARTRITGSGVSVSGRIDGPLPDEHAEVLEAIGLATVVERRVFLGEMALDLGARQSRHALDRRYRSA